MLVLADGSVFEGELFGAPTAAAGRGRVQHRAVRLPGDPHRPELRRADHHVHEPAHRQLRRQRDGLRVGPAVLPRASSCASCRAGRATGAREADLDAMLVRYGIPGITGIDTRRLTRLIRDTGAIPGAFGPGRRSSPTSSIAAARGAGHRRHRPRRHRHDARAVHGRPRRRVPDRRLRLRHQAHDPAPPRRARHGRGRAGDDARRRRRRPRPRRHLPVQRARRPGRGRRRHGDPRRPARHAASRSSGSASATSCSAGRSAARRSSCRSATTAPTTPCKDLTTGAIEITSQNHNFAVAIDSLAGVADLTHVNLNDGVCEGLAARDANAFSVQHHPEAGPGPHDSRYLFTRFADRMVAYRGGRIPNCSVSGQTGRLRTVRIRPRTGRAAGAGSGGRPDAAARRPPLDPRHRVGADRDRPGVRVRLLGHPGLPRAARGGLPRRPRQLEPGDDHDRPRLRRPHVHRAADARGAGGDHRARAARRRAADARRPDRPQHRDGALRAGPDRRARHAGDDRRQRRGHRHRRGPRAVQGGDDRDRPRRAALAASPTPLDEARTIAAEIGLPIIIRPAYILGGRGTGIAATIGGARPPRRSPASPPARSARSSSRSRSPAGRSSSSR